MSKRIDREKLKRLVNEAIDKVRDIENAVPTFEVYARARVYSDTNAIFTALEDIKREVE